MPEVGEVRSAHKFSGGQSNPTYRLVTDTGELVLRAKPAGNLLPSAHQVGREFRVMRALADTDVPVPEVLHLTGEGDASPLGRQFFVMRLVEGAIYWQPSLPTLSRDQRLAVTQSMNRTLAALHQVDIDSVGLTDFGRPGQYVARQLARWTKQYRAAETERYPAMDRVIAWLESELPEDDGSVSLVHGDFRLDNLIFDPDTHKVVAVLDWELATLGHPVSDLAYQCMQWRLPVESTFHGLRGLDCAALGLPDEAAYVAQYCERVGREAIPHWHYFLAFNFFRLGAILQGVYKRSLDGNASNPERARELGAAVPQLADAAWQMIETGS